MGDRPIPRSSGRWGRVYLVWGVFFLRAARNPIQYLSFIDFTIWANLVHGLIMVPQSYVIPGFHHKLLTDVAYCLVLSGGLLILRPRGPERSAGHAECDRLIHILPSQCRRRLPEEPVTLPVVRVLALVVSAGFAVVVAQDVQVRPTLIPGDEFTIEVTRSVEDSTLPGAGYSSTTPVLVRVVAATAEGFTLDWRPGEIIMEGAYRPAPISDGRLRRRPPAASRSGWS